MSISEITWIDFLVGANMQDKDRQSELPDDGRQFKDCYSWNYVNVSVASGNGMNVLHQQKPRRRTDLKK